MHSSSHKPDAALDPMQPPTHDKRPACGSAGRNTGMTALARCHTFADLRLKTRRRLPLYGTAASDGGHAMRALNHLNREDEWALAHHGGESCAETRDVLALVKSSRKASRI